MKSLRSKLTITIVLVVFGSSVLLSFIGYQRAKSSLVTQLEDNYAVAAQKYALELSSWVSTNATIIDTMAAEIAVNDISTKGYDAFHEYLKHSYELLNKNGYVYDVYFTYPDNFMACASDFVSDGTVDFVHEREWYTTSALTGELFYSTPYLDSDSGKPVITISKAVYRDNELLGVLAADIFVDVLVDIIRDAEVGENCYAFLVDQNMCMIAHPDPTYEYDDKPLSVTGVSGDRYRALVQSILSDTKDMVFVQDYDGVTRGITYSQMINTGWYVCIATDRQLMTEGVSSLIIGFVIATIVSIIVGALIAIVLAHVLDQLNRQEQEYKQRVLRLEKQAADQASEAKSRFLADMSHEIRTPINAIIGMNEMILRETDNREILGYSQNIKQSGHNLLQLINGILDFSKIEDGKMEILPSRYSVSSQIAYYLNAIEGRASAKNLELIFHIDPALPTELYGDDTRINQIIMNLLNNAVKYTEKGSVTLTIEGRERNEEKNEILLYVEVKDTGIGIREDDMARLFESFERLDEVRNRNIEGTGLGMTITKELLELMGSELHVESRYGEGSAFSFELWQKIENEEPLGDYQKAIATQAENSSYRVSFRAPGARILVVDDTKTNILVVENLLKKTELRIDTAISGQESVRLAKENAYDLILMDQRMPGMDGTEAMQQIRLQAESKNALTPIICLTADVVGGAKDRYLEMGFDDYLTKPVEGTKLEKMLAKYLPTDKVRLTKIALTETEGPESAEAGFLHALQEFGMDTGAGMAFCGGDVGMYQEVLNAFAKEGPERSQNIQDCYDAKNWEDYGIYIHSLKSATRTIGATRLSELAASVEAAAKEGDIAAIENNHDRIMERYAQLLAFIDAHTEAVVTDDPSGDEVFEFEPQ
ncbi:MAG: response regulator [Lachnospiraceae bacterium]|nr:response regulator [Lachnospiraceae bacterium]